MRGRKQTPTALKVARGNPGGRPLNEQEPEFEAPGEVAPPADLAGAGLAEWNDQFPRLTSSGVLTAADIGGFTHYCRLISQEEWVLGKFAKAATSQNPLDAAMALKYSNQLLKISTARRGWAALYGITPSSRSGVKAKKPVDPADAKRKRFLNVANGGTA